MSGQELLFPQASESFKRLNAAALGLGVVGMPKVPVKAVEEVKAKGEGCKFVIKGEPMGAPRQSRCDTWRPRPVVLRYRAFKDAARAAAPEGMSQEPYGVRIQAYLSMPASWSKKKKLEMEGKAHRVKPDWDNVAKGVCDALWEQDSCIASGVVTKTWCWAGEERLEVEVIL